MISNNLIVLIIHKLSSNKKKLMCMSCHQLCFFMHAPWFTWLNGESTKTTTRALKVSGNCVTLAIFLILQWMFASLLFVCWQTKGCQNSPSCFPTKKNRACLFPNSSIHDPFSRKPYTKVNIFFFLSFIFYFILFFFLDDKNKCIASIHMLLKYSLNY
jgi:hypothetical protein